MATGSSMVTVRLDAEMIKWLAKVSDEAGVTRSDLIRSCIAHVQDLTKDAVVVPLER